MFLDKKILDRINKIYRIVCHLAAQSCKSCLRNLCSWVLIGLWLGLLVGTAAAQTEPLPTPDAEGIIYVQVQPNDALWSIAARAGLTLSELLALNNLTEDAVVQPGDLLIVGRVTPVPTETAVPRPPPTLPPPTAVPTDSPSSTAICLGAFDDGNQNGQQDGDEPLKAGVVFTVFNDSAVVGNYVTDGVSEPYCLEGLTSGTYSVTRSVEANETLTTGGNWELVLAQNTVLTQLFGSFEGEVRVAETAVSLSPATTPTSVPTPTAENASPSSGLLSSPIVWVGLVGLILIGSVLLFWVRRTAQ